MKYVKYGVLWVLAVLFALFAASMALLGNWISCALTAAVCLLCLPVFGRLLSDRAPRLAHPIVRVLAVFVLLTVNVLVSAGSKRTSIYNSTQVEEELGRIYEEKMREWPVPYEDVYVETEYGPVHAVVSGEGEAPPLLLLHASAVSSWSWKYNVEDLCRHFRVYAIDLIGDAGKSGYRSLEHVLETGADQARLYAAIADSLGIASAYVAGASEGGFIATNYALHYPQRVRKMALIGPMGYSGALGAIIRITLAQMFPLRPVQEWTFDWAFSSDPAIRSDFGEWFRLVMSGTFPKKVAPLTFSPEERRRISVPVLFIFGERDNLVGDPRKAGEAVQDIADVEVRVLDTGHLIAAEKPQAADELLIGFFEER